MHLSAVHSRGLCVWQAAYQHLNVCSIFMKLPWRLPSSCTEQCLVKCIRARTGYIYQHRPLKRCTTSICSAANADVVHATSYDPLPEGERLRDWVLAHGGHVHPSIALVENGPSGSGRGLIATAPIRCIRREAGHLDSEPLVAVPEEYMMTTDHAVAYFEARLAQYGVEAPKPDRLQAPFLLAMFLACQKAAGQKSLWHPYIGALPAQPPCAWLMDEQQLRQALTQFPDDVAGRWYTDVLQSRTDKLSNLSAVCQLYDTFLPELTLDSMSWALGQVLSRSFGNEEALALVPFVDFCNHSPRAHAPVGQIDADADEDDPEADVYSVVYPMMDGELVDMFAGDELLISYVQRGTTPLESFINFGFVPQELTDLM